MIMIVLFHCLAFNAGGWQEFHNQVMYGDLLISCNRNISYVGLNAFVFIAGVLYYRINRTGKYDNTRLFIFNKFERLLVPYFLWGILLCIIFYGYEYPTQLLYGISHLWFLLMLFEVFIIIELAKKIWNTTVVKEDIMIVFFLLCLDYVVSKLNLIPMNNHHQYLLTLQQTFDYIPVFYIGMLVDKYKLYDKFHFRGGMTITLVFSLFIIGILPFMLHLPLSRFYQWMPTCCLILIVYSGLHNSELNHTGGVSRRFLISLDKNSLSIYIIHHILIFAYYYYVSEGQELMTNHYVIAPLIMFITVFIMSYLISCTLSYVPGSKYIIGTQR